MFLYMPSFFVRLLSYKTWEVAPKKRQPLQFVISTFCLLTFYKNAFSTSVPFLQFDLHCRRRVFPSRSGPALLRRRNAKTRPKARGRHSLRPASLITRPRASVAHAIAGAPIRRTAATCAQRWKTITKILPIFFLLFCDQHKH